VLGELLDTVGVAVPGRAVRKGALAAHLPLEPASRRPLELAPRALDAISASPIPINSQPAEAPEASIIVVSHDNLPLTRLCVESVIANSEAPPFELIVVDNGSRDGSRVYLRTLARRFPNVHLLLNDENEGFPAACNQGLERARGDLLVLLNNDTIVPPGWLSRLARHAAEPSVGLVGPVTNRIGNEAEVAVAYQDYAKFLATADLRAREHAGKAFDISMPAMFCIAFRRDAYNRLGPLDEAFGMGTLEDDDYAERAREAGYRSLCAEDVLVHHFGEGSLGRMFQDGSYGELISANRRRFEQKWGKAWQPYGRRQTGDYESVRERVRAIVESRVPLASAVIVASRGDEELIRFDNREGWHFPQMDDGVYAGHYPADSDEAIAELERLRARGGRYFLLPKTSMWWLDHYRAFGSHLEQQHAELVRDDACLVFALSEEAAA
jgi:GT2 family glycosyltransferase